MIFHRSLWDPLRGYGSCVERTNNVEPLLVGVIEPTAAPRRAGKVMGFAPWAAKWTTTDVLPPPQRLTSGSLLSDGTDGNAFRVHWETIERLPRPNDLKDETLRPFYAALAAEAQAGLEEAAMEFIEGLKERTGEKNLCLCGGVALNSVLNGRVAREVGGAGRRSCAPREEANYHPLLGLTPVDDAGRLVGLPRFCYFCSFFCMYERSTHLSFCLSCLSGLIPDNVKYGGLNK